MRIERSKLCVSNPFSTLLSMITSTKSTIIPSLPPWPRGNFWLTCNVGQVIA